MSSVRHSCSVSAWKVLCFAGCNCFAAFFESLENHVLICVHFKNSLVCLPVALGNLGCALGTFWPSKERARWILRLERLPWFYFQLLCETEDKLYLFSSNNGLTISSTETFLQFPRLITGIYHPQDNPGRHSGNVFAYAISWKREMAS